MLRKRSIILISLSLSLLVSFIPIAYAFCEYDNICTGCGDDCGQGCSSRERTYSYTGGSCNVYEYYCPGGCSDLGGCYCSGTGLCGSECNSDSDCDDGNPCTTDTCRSDCTCSNTPKTDGTSCGGECGVCYSGECENDHDKCKNCEFCSSSSYDCRRDDLCSPGDPTSGIQRCSYDEDYEECRCPFGEADCDYDIDCQEGLICGYNIGADFGCSEVWDFCVECTSDSHCDDDNPCTTDTCGSNYKCSNDCNPMTCEDFLWEDDTYGYNCEEWDDCCGGIVDCGDCVSVNKCDADCRASGYDYGECGYYQSTKIDGGHCECKYFYDTENAYRLYDDICGDFTIESDAPYWKDGCFEGKCACIPSLEIEYPSPSSECGFDNCNTFFGCPDKDPCVDGICQCEDKCSSGARRCSGDVAQICMDCDIDSCLDWCTVQDCANLGDEYDCVNGYCRDVVDPETSIRCNNEECLEGCWYDETVSITLFCSDEGSGCDKTYYCYGVSCNPNIDYKPFNLPEGTNDVGYQSTDNDGNIEETNYKRIRVDTSIDDEPLESIVTVIFSGSEIRPVQLSLDEINPSEPSITVEFNPEIVEPPIYNSKMIIKITPITPPGIYNIRIKGVGDGITETATYILDVSEGEPYPEDGDEENGDGDGDGDGNGDGEDNYEIFFNPSSDNIAAGESTTSTITADTVPRSAPFRVNLELESITTTNGETDAGNFDITVSFVDGWVWTYWVDIDPESLEDTMTITTESTTPADSYLITVKGRSGTAPPVERTKTFSLVVAESEPVCGDGKCENTKGENCLSCTSDCGCAVGEKCCSFIEPYFCTPIGNPCPT